MRVPGQELLHDFDADGTLDYSPYATSFASLSVGFISQMLGLDPPAVVADGPDKGLDDAPDAAVASGVGAEPAEILGAAPRPPARTGPAPTDVEHPFTNDDVDNAYRVSSLPFRARTDTSN